MNPSVAIPVTSSFVFQFGPRSYDLSSRTHIMGVLNVTPDSFSDGGLYLDPERAIEGGLRMASEGADFIDIGGESTRPRGSAYGPGAAPVSVDEELRRVIPVIEKLHARTDVPISIDTTKSEVAREALRAGVAIVNDISGLRFDVKMATVVAEAGATAVIMHTRGTPAEMQMNTHYDDLFQEIRTYLSDGIAIGLSAGIRQMFVDPGIGFGKSHEGNLKLIADLGRLTDLGCPILVGPSRKNFIGRILDLPVHDRLEGTLASVVACILRGASVVRVHDVKEAKRASLVADAIKQSQEL